jgi:hypothetical protein
VEVSQSTKQSEESQRDRSAIINNHYYLPNYGADFYPDTIGHILPCCGYEYGTYDFGAALEVLNDKLNLRLDRIDLDVFRLLLTGLSQSNRFGGSLNIPVLFGENSAVHSCHSLVLKNEFIRRATLSLSNYNPSEVASFAIETSIALLVHDMGEMWKEISSLSQRNADSSLQEVPEVERRIFKLCLSEAYRVVCSYNSNKGLFYEKLSEMRKRSGLGLMDPNRSSVDLKRIIEAVDYFEKEQKGYEFSSDILNRIDFYLSHYDLAEGLNKSDKVGIFRGVVAKVIEHMQGTRHFIRFAHRDEGSRGRIKLLFPNSLRSRAEEFGSQYQQTIPMNICTSYNVIGSAKYNEGGLEVLAQCSESGLEQNIAKQLIQSVYLTTVELVWGMCKAVNRKATSQGDLLNSFIKERKDCVMGSERYLQITDTIKRIQEYEINENLKSYSKYSQAIKDSDRLNDIETRERICALYLKAAISGYQPKDSVPLILKDELPAELEGFSILTPLFANSNRVLTADDVRQLEQIDPNKIHIFVENFN